MLTLRAASEARGAANSWQKWLDNVVNSVNTRPQARYLLFSPLPLPLPLPIPLLCRWAIFDAVLGWGSSPLLFPVGGDQGAVVSPGSVQRT